MARRAQEEDRNDGWKDTYGDMVTLLLCFFVLLYSMSSVNSEKWEAFVKAFSNPGEDTAQVVLTPSSEKGDHMVPGNEMQDGAGTDPTEEPPLEFENLFEYLEEFVEENNMQDSIELAQGEGVVYVRYQNSLFFRPDSYQLTEEARPNLDFLGQSLKTLEDQIWLISISGHTASVNSDNYGVSDWLLSAERAAVVAQYFEEENEIAPKLLRPIAFGKNYPIDTNDESSGREHNRRVELVIISNDSPLAESPELAQAVSGLFTAEPFEGKDKMDSIEDLLDPEKFNKSTGTVEPDSSSAPEDDEDQGASSSNSAVLPDDSTSSAAPQPEDESGAGDSGGSGSAGDGGASGSSSAAGQDSSSTSMQAPPPDAGSSGAGE